MTYPPQPPGPPGPYNQGPYNQDPYNQGPYNQGPPGQPPWMQGPQGGFPPVGPPPKRRTGLITALIIVAVLVVGGGGVGAYLLLREDERGKGSGGSGDEGGGARVAAQTYVRELENLLNTPLPEVDPAKLEPVTCADDFAKMSDDIEDAKDVGKSASASPGNERKIRLRLKDFERTADGATFTMTERVVGDSDADSKDLTVAKEGGDWRVCGFFDAGSSEPGGGSEPSGEPSGEPSSEPSGGPGSEDSDPPASGEVPPNPFPTR